MGFPVWSNKTKLFVSIFHRLKGAEDLGEPDNKNELKGDHMNTGRKPEL